MVDLLCTLAILAMSWSEQREGYAPSLDNGVTKSHLADVSVSFSLYMEPIHRTPGPERPPRKFNHFFFLNAAVVCSVLTDPTNGFVSFTTTTFNSVATYTCTSNYVISGSRQRTCLETGQWSGEEPTCISESFINSNNTSEM